MIISSYLSKIKTISLSGGQVVANSLFVNELSTLGLKSFQDIIEFSEGELVKQKAGLEIRKVKLSSRNNSVFIKKHWQPIDSKKSEGRIEFEEYVRFRNDGLATPNVVAYGDKTAGNQLVSFVITEDFHPLVDLEELVLNKPDFFTGAENKQRRQSVLGAVAKYARNMHDAGCNQKDFNATHILLADYDTENPKVALFDLQRVDRKKWQKLRWVVKSLGELIFTLPASQFDQEDHLFLFKSYLGREQLTFYDRIVFRLILAKRDRIARHSKKWNQAPKMKS